MDRSWTTEVGEREGVIVIFSDPLYCAGKQWSGLVTDYYVPRWELFFKELESSIISRTAFDEEKFRKTFLEQQGRPFCENTKSYPTNSTGDTIEIAKELYSKWSTYI